MDKGFLAALDSIRNTLRDDVLRSVDDRINEYRRAVWVKDEWCCKEMTEFALKFWSASRPRTDEMWGVQYQIRGHALNYCPFCGAFVGKK